MVNLKLNLDGMGCGGCVKNVQNALAGIPGVRVENVSVGSAVLAYDPDQSSPEAVVAALDRAGYPARAVSTPPVAREGGCCGR